MRTNLEIAAELIFAEVRNLNNIKEYCGYPEYTEEDEIDRKTLEAMVNTLLSIVHERQRKEWENS